MMMARVMISLVMLVRSCVCLVTQEPLSSEEVEMTLRTDQTTILNVSTEGGVCVLSRGRQPLQCDEVSGQLVRLPACVHTVTRQAAEDNTTTCSAVGDRVCHSPCYNCPVACRKTFKTVCQLRHNVVRNVTVSGGVLREEETLRKNITCHEEEEEKLCAPINCNFVNISSACTESQGPGSLVELRTRECPLCQAWTKHCAASRQEIQHFLQDKQQPVDERPRSVPSSQVPPPDRAIQSLKDDLLLIIENEEKLMQENLRMMTNLNVKPENVNVNIKYNIVTNTEKYNESQQTNAVDPILNILDNIIEIPTEQPKGLKDEAITTSEERIRENKELYVSSTLSTITTTTTAKPRGVTAPLTAADFLRLCFTSGKGCDFSRDFPTSTEPNTTPPPTPTPTPTPPPTTSTSPPTESPLDEAKQERKERLRQRLKLCFFSGICGNDDKRSKVRQPRIIASDITTTKKSSIKTRREKLKLMVERKARACFLDGRC